MDTEEVAVAATVEATVAPPRTRTTLGGTITNAVCLQNTLHFTCFPPFLVQSQHTKHSPTDTHKKKTLVTPTPNLCRCRYLTITMFHKHTHTHTTQTHTNNTCTSLTNSTQNMQHDSLNIMQTYIHTHTPNHSTLTECVATNSDTPTHEKDMK